MSNKNQHPGILMKTVEPPVATLNHTVLCLSTFFSTDRILLYSGFLEHLRPLARPRIWSWAGLEAAFTADIAGKDCFEVFDGSASIPEWLNVLRHFLDYCWDHKKLSTSRASFWRLRKSQESPRKNHVLRRLAKMVAALSAPELMERAVERLVIRYSRNQQVYASLLENQVDAVFSLVPFQPNEMAIIAAAKRLSIPTIAFITSWDNLTTKNRLLFDYDVYVVWSEQMKQELYRFYPKSRNKPVYIVGGVQYDAFVNQRYQLSRAEFFRQNALDPARPMIAYCLGSPNLIREDHGALRYLELLRSSSDLAQAQVVIRPHPGFYEKGYTELTKIKERFPDVIIQSAHRYWKKVAFQNEESITEWVNTIKHADVVVNLSSTIAVDAAIFDRPVINLDFDPEPGAPNQQLVKEINHQWDHFQPIAHSGGIWLVNDYDDLLKATRTYLAKPELHREARKWIVRYVCGEVDGRAGERLAEAIFAALSQGDDAAQTAKLAAYPIAERSDWCQE